MSYSVLIRRLFPSLKSPYYCCFSMLYLSYSVSVCHVYVCVYIRTTIEITACTFVASLYLIYFHFVFIFYVYLDNV